MRPYMGQKILKSLVRIGIALCIVLGVAWWLMAQPEIIKAGGTEVLQAHADPRNLEAHVRKLSGDFRQRDYRHPGVLEYAADYIAQQMQASGLTVERQKFKVDGNEYQNVIGRRGPPTSERLVIGAHYDVFSQDQALPGADDNASGVAGLLELARMSASFKSSVSIDFVAYSLEEPPYFKTDQMGSAHHAESLRKDGVSLRGMIGLEMIGYFTDAPGSQEYPSMLLKLFYPSVGDFIAVVGNMDSRQLTREVRRLMRRTELLPVHSLNGPAEIPGVDFSDHASYWNRGYKAVMVTDTAFFRNKNYHTAGDLPETLNYAKMAQVVDAVSAAAAELSK